MDIDGSLADVADIATNRVEQLCAPFYSTKAEGMGMGLAICRSIVEAHQGVLDASDAGSGGALFSFSLPLTRQHHGETTHA